MAKKVLVQKETHFCPFHPPAGDQVLAGHRRQSFHGTAEDRERKCNSGSESPARTAEHVSLSSQNSKIFTVSLQGCFWLHILIVMTLNVIGILLIVGWWAVVLSK